MSAMATEPPPMLLTGPVLGCIVGTLLCVTTLLYLSVESGEKNEFDVARETNATGIWPAPTGDFNWCEPDYVYTPVVMELWNTLTSLCFCIGPMVTWSAARNWEMRFNLLLVVGIGLGSAAFHATLHYTAQLTDELPMIFFIAHTTAMLASADASCPRWLKPAMATLAALLFATPREALVHKAGRVLMVLSFSACFIWLAFSAAATVAELDRRAGGSFARRKYGQASIAVLVAIVSWVCDNLACKALHSLPGLPYPQLHATVWHTCSAPPRTEPGMAALAERILAACDMHAAWDLYLKLSGSLLSGSSELCLPLPVHGGDAQAGGGRHAEEGRIAR